jgi:hypothetical protein
MHSLGISDIANVTLLIASMDLFPVINSVYSTFFGSSPPARACVATDLPSPYRLQMECIAFASCHSSDRRSLHVQSLSYWAPANIGPYSQAITVTMIDLSCHFFYLFAGRQTHFHIRPNWPCPVKSQPALSRVTPSRISIICATHTYYNRHYRDNHGKLSR